MARLPVPKAVTDIIGAMEATRPHQQAANDKLRSALELLREADDPTSDLAPQQRAQRREEVGILRQQAHAEMTIVARIWDEERARHPKWIQK